MVKHGTRPLAQRCRWPAAVVAVVCASAAVDVVLAAQDPDPQPEPPPPYSLCQCCHPEFPTICDTTLCHANQGCRCQWGGGDGDAWVDASCRDAAGA